MPKPLCIYCKRQVQDYKVLRRSVRWNTGEYAHSGCYKSAIGGVFENLSGMIDGIAGRKRGE